MTSRKRPEQRSTAAERRPGQPAAQPSGDEVFSPAPQASAASDQPDLTPEEEAAFDELERAASAAYEQLGQAAATLSERASEAYQSGREFVKEHPGSTLLSAFAVGILLGVLGSRD